MQSTDAFMQGRAHERNVLEALRGVRIAGGSMKIEIHYDGIWTARCAKADVLDLMRSQELLHPVATDDGHDEDRELGAMETLEAYAGSPEKALHDLMNLIGRVTISTLASPVASRGRK